MELKELAEGRFPYEGENQAFHMDKYDATDIVRTSYMAGITEVGFKFAEWCSYNCYSYSGWYWYKETGEAEPTMIGTTEKLFQIYLNDNP